MDRQNKIILSYLSILLVIYIALSLPTNGPEEIKISYPYKSNVNTLDFSPDGKLLAAGYEEGYVRVWNTVDGEEISVTGNVIEKERLMNTLGKHQMTPVTDIKFSPDGKYILSGGCHAEFEYYDKDSNKLSEPEIFDPSKVDSWSVNEVSEVSLWSVNEGNCIRTHYLENSDVESVAFSPDGKSYAASYKNNYTESMTTIYIWSTETGEVLNSVTSPDYMVQSLVFTPDGRHLAVSYEGNPNHRIVFWDLENMSADLVIETNDSIDSIHDLHFSNDGSILAGISDYINTIIIWDADTGDVLRTFETTHGLSGHIDLSPDGEYVVGIESMRMMMWSVTSGEKILDISSLPEVGNRIDFTCLQFSPDMDYMAAGVRVPPASYSLSLDDYMTAYDSGVDDNLLREIEGDTPIFLWDFHGLAEGGYIESIWDIQRQFPRFSVIVIWAPTLAFVYFLLFIISGIIKARKEK
jgi:WD40 repeat protein